MNTPIYDFVQSYLKKDPIRMHMPGHKGQGALGIEASDITEIDGADVLYHEEGILLESQQNATALFGSAKSLYSTEGATLCIRAMLAMVKYYGKEIGKAPLVLASRNAHKSFLTSCALLDLDPIWVQSESASLLSCSVTPESLETYFENQTEKPLAVYLTSPDYLGNMMDIKQIAKVCHNNGALLLVDNAHGAYLHFLPDAAHPLDLGADLVCDSAHKTLPVLTGGSYLHVSKFAPKMLCDYAGIALSLFSSTSPSYLILQSLDLCNAYLDQGYQKKLYEAAAEIHELKKKMRRHGYQTVGSEPLKVTVLTKPYGYAGTDFAEILKTKNIYVEFSDPDFIVLMLTPEQDQLTLDEIFKVFSEIPQKDPILSFPPKIPAVEKCISPKEAIFSACETLSVDTCKNRILAQPGVTCPPAIPIAVCGERLTQDHINAFGYYGIKKVSVTK